MRKLIFLLLGIFLISNVYAISWSGGTTTVINQTVIENLTIINGNLSELQDVNIPSPNDQDILAFNDSSNNWTSQTFDFLNTIFQRIGNVISPKNSGDSLDMSGGDITADNYLGNGGTLDGIFNESESDSRYVNKEGDLFSSKVTQYNFSFSNSSLPIGLNNPQISFKSNESHATMVLSVENDGDSRINIFSAGTNNSRGITQFLPLDNGTGIAVENSDFKFIVQEIGRSFIWQQWNGTALKDSLVLQEDGNLLLQGRLLFEDNNKSIYTDQVNGGSGLFFLSNESLAGGETPFVFVALNASGSQIKPLILQNGKNNSGGNWKNSMIIGGHNGIIDENNLTNCLFMLDLWGLPIRVGCDTDNTGADVIIEDDIELGGTVFAEEGIRAENIANFIMNGNDLNVFNGSVHPQTPTTFTSGFEPGDSFISLTATFPGTINPFVNLDVTPEVWISTTSVLCDEGDCAEASGSSGSVDITMHTNFSTLNVNQTELNFIYSLFNLIGSDNFRVETNNFSGSGWEQQFTDAGTETTLSQSISLGETYSNLSIVGLRFVCDVTQALRNCYVDTVKVNGTFTANTTATVNSFNTEYCGGDGSRDVNGNCNVGIRWDAETAQWIFAGTLNATGTITGGISGSGTTNNWAKFISPTSIANAPVSDDGNSIAFTLPGAFDGAINSTDWSNVSGSQISNGEGWASSSLLNETYARLFTGNNINGTQTFNGGFLDGGLSIIAGDLYAQALYVLNISSLLVTHININGSFIPSIANAFDIGNSSSPWRDLWIGRNANISGDLIAGETLFVNSTSGNVGIGTTSPDGLLDTTPDTITTTSYAYPLPRMNTSQMDALTGAQEGAYIFNTQVGGKFFNNGTGWIQEVQRQYFANSSAGPGSFNVTGTNWATGRAVAIPYQTSDGAWRMKFNVNGVLSVASATLGVTFSGVTFLSTYQQAISITSGSARTKIQSRVTPGTGTAAGTFTLTTTTWRFSGDVELDSKPTWAD